MINVDRKQAGLPPVVLGSNAAAQQHAEEMLTNGYLSHWGLDGLKPYMRYTIAGGYNYEAENVLGPNYRLDPNCRYREIRPIEEIREAQESFMKSSGHRANILNKWHKKVNIGIACNRYTCSVVQQFEGDYVEFTQKPNIHQGVLSLAGSFKDGFVLDSNALVALWYDEMPHQLLVGQLQRTYAYTVGQKPVAFIREPSRPGYYYLPNEATTITWEAYTDPYKAYYPIDSASLPLVAPCSSYSLAQPVPSPSFLSAKVPYVTANLLTGAGPTFTVTADVSDIIRETGKGVYTMLVWGARGNESALLVKYPIFVQ